MKSIVTKKPSIHTDQIEHNRQPKRRVSTFFLFSLGDASYQERAPHTLPCRTWPACCLLPVAVASMASGTACLRHLAHKRSPPRRQQSAVGAVMLHLSVKSSTRAAALSRTPSCMPLLWLLLCTRSPCGVPCLALWYLSLSSPRVGAPRLPERSRTVAGVCAGVSHSSSSHLYMLLCAMALHACGHASAVCIIPMSHMPRESGVRSSCAWSWAALTLSCACERCRLHGVTALAASLRASRAACISSEHAASGA
jgi:hypothetical protein